MNRALALAVTVAALLPLGCGAPPGSSADDESDGEADGGEGRPNEADSTSSSGTKGTTSSDEGEDGSSSSSSSVSSDASSGTTDTGTSSSTTTDTSGEDGPLPDMLDPDAPWYALGTGEFDYTPLHDGDSIDLVLGPQGAWMFPMPLRGGNFTIPDDPLDWQHPDAPKLSMVFDIEDFETSFGDYFYELSDYAVPLSVLDSGEYEFIYVPVIAPDDFFTICDIHGHAATMTSSLLIADQTEALSFDLELTINVPPPGGVPCDEP